MRGEKWSRLIEIIAEWGTRDWVACRVELGHLSLLKRLLYSLIISHISGHFNFPRYSDSKLY